MKDRSDITNTTALARTRPDPLILFCVPGAVEAQEARGQREMVASTSLPSKVHDREIFEAFGFTFGKPYKDDPLFAPATMPDGWKKLPTDHDMWSKIVDEKGRHRARIFYKAAFYDRGAYLSLVNRYVVDTRYGDDGANVTTLVRDGRDVLFRTPMFASASKQEVWDAADAQQATASAWMDANRPEWKDPIKQWQDAPVG